MRSSPRRRTSATTSSGSKSWPACSTAGRECTWTGSWPATPRGSWVGRTRPRRKLAELESRSQPLAPGHQGTRAPVPLAPPAGPENDRERRKAAQHQAIAARPGELVPPGGEPQARVTAEQFLEGHPGFEPGQGRAQAVVDPVAEPQVRPVTAADVEDVR